MQNEIQKTAPEIAAALIKNGYRPIPIPHGQKGPRISDWQVRTFCRDDFAEQSNVGILCGHGDLAFLDIDVTDKAVVEAVVAEWQRRHAGAWMQRTGRAPKTGFPFRFTAKGERKRTLDLGDLGAVEVLCTGQQFVAFGIHPDTGQPYHWHGLDPLDTFLGVAEMLPEIKPKEITNFLAWVKDNYAPEKPSESLSERASAAMPQPAQWHLDAAQGPSLMEAEEILRWINPDCEYDDWRSVLMAIHSGFGGSQEGLTLADEWSANGAKYKPGEVPQKWDSFKGHGVKWATAAALARQNGADLSAIARKYSNRATDVSRLFTSMEVSKDQAPDNGPKPARESQFYSAASLQGKPIPPREWLVQGLVPQNTVTLFSGDGGTGKSLLALQLAVAVAAQTSWIGKTVTTGRVIFLSAEDDNDELHRRLDDILTAESKAYDDLSGLTLRSLAGEDALLAVDAQLALMQTALFEELDKRAAEEDPALIVIDTLADVYPANENDRAKVRQFVGILRGLAIKRKCAVLLLGHPSLTGLNSGTGTSGSTAWNNSVRSRLYLSRISDNGFEPDADARVLSTKKANYGRTGGEINLKWEAGVFVAEAQPTGLDALAAGAKGERVFLQLLDAFTAQGRRVNASGGKTYAPKEFAEHPKSEGVTKQAFKAAMNRLLGEGKVCICQEGPPSRRVSFLKVAR